MTAPGLAVEGALESSTCGTRSDLGNFSECRRREPLLPHQRASPRWPAARGAGRGMPEGHFTSAGQLWLELWLTLAARRVVTSKPRFRRAQKAPLLPDGRPALRGLRFRAPSASSIWPTGLPCHIWPIMRSVAYKSREIGHAWRIRQDRPNMLTFASMAAREALVEAIRAVLTRRGTSVRAVALEAGLPVRSVQNVLDGHDPGLSRASEICDALGLEFYIGPPREGQRWGPLAITADLPSHIRERLESLAAEYEDWPLARRQEFIEHFSDAMNPLLRSPRERPGRGMTTDAADDAQAALQARHINEGSSGDTSAWTNATAAQRERVSRQLTTIERSNALASKGMSRTEADATAAKEAGVSVNSVKRWRQRVRGLQPEGQRAALLERKRSGRPSVIDDRTRETLEDLILRRGLHLSATSARKALIAQYGKAPAVSTVRSWLARITQEIEDRPAPPSHELPSGVEALPGSEQNAAADTSANADRVARAVEMTEAMLTNARIPLGPEERARLVLAVYEQLYEKGGDVSRSAFEIAPKRDQGVA